MSAPANSPGQPPAKKAKVEESKEAAEAFMEAAAASAHAGVALKHGGPFGAAIVRRGVFVATSHNTVLRDGDPTCHAEMNAIRYACSALQCHDLSDCEIYTTCEPCPMCWGAIRWSRLNKVYIGVDRFTAAKFGFDDKVFYDEVGEKGKNYAPVCPVVPADKDPASPRSRLSLTSTNPWDKGAMLEVVHTPNSMDAAGEILRDTETNRTLKRRLGGEEPAAMEPPSPRTKSGAAKNDNADHRKFYQVCKEAVDDAVRTGENKEREIFAAAVVKDGEVVSLGVNRVLKKRDATATAEVVAIRKAAKRLKTYNLEGCTMYTTVEPDVMSLGAVLWSRIGTLYYGRSQKEAAQYGFEEGLLQYRELLANPDLQTRNMDVLTGYAYKPCESVFKRWQELNGVVY